MLLNWTVTWVTLSEHARRKRASRLEDPLDADEWQPFRWAVPIIAFLLRQQRAQRPGTKEATWPEGAQFVSKPSRIT